MLKKNNFSGGTDGVSISTANSGGTSGDAFNSVLSSTASTYSTTNATGSRAPLVAKFTGNPGLRWNLTLSGRTAYVRAYVYLTSYPTSDLDVIRLDVDINVAAHVRVTTTGNVCVATASAVVANTTTPGPIPLNQWVRLEAQITGGTSSTGTCELRVYHNADSTTATATTTGSGANFRTTAFDRCNFNGVSGYTYYVDNVAVSDVDWIGTDSVSDTATPSTVTSTWSLPAPSISAGSSAAPATISTTWVLEDPEVVTADGLTPVNPNRVESAWSLPAPTIAAFRNVTVTPATVESTWQVLDPFAGVPVNPGDKLDRPGQIEWNGFVIGSGTPYRMVQLDGWITDMPNLDSTNVAQPNRHGSYSGRKYSQERTVTLSGRIRTRREDMEQVVQALIRETPVLQDDTELPLAIRLHNVIYVGYGSVLRRSIPVDHDYRMGRAKLTMQWLLSDPLLLSRELNSAVIGDGASQILTNLGNAETYPTFRIPGPAVNPAVEIENSGIERLLEFNITVPSGQTLIIDPYYGTVTLAGAVVNATQSSTAVTDMVLPSGQNTVTYDGGGSGPEITVLWRHAYL